MMDNNPLFEDDFEVPGVQPSTAIPVSEIPEQSQSAWYDLEDEDLTLLSMDENDEDVSTLVDQHQAPSRISRQTNVRKAMAVTSSPPGRWQQVFSLRTVILGIAMIALVSGVVFARGFFSASTTNAQNASQRGMQQTMMSTPAQPLVTALPTPTSTPTAQPTTVTQNMPAMPAAWTASGRGMADMFEAFSVAETFTQRYETIDFRSPATLSSSRFILTNAANQRFVARDQRNTDTFANQIQQQQLVQAVIIMGAQLVQAQNQNGNFFAWITVSYQLAMQQGQGMPVTTNKTMTLLLIAVPFNTPNDAPPMGGIGWLVSSYQFGNVLPAIPALP